MVKQIRDMAASGIRMIGLGALGYDARPEYNKTAAAKCRKVGMDILACTPEKLAEAMAYREHVDWRYKRPAPRE